jgi:RIP metalloprotease RseP
MDWLFVAGVLFFVLVLLVTVAIHEAGHMTAAKALKLDVPEYSVGFGPKLFTIRTKKTAYSLRAIPLGGFVLITDMRYPEKSYERSALSRVSPWKRQIVFFAGPAVNSW